MSPSLAPPPWPHSSRPDSRWELLSSCAVHASAQFLTGPRFTGRRSRITISPRAQQLLLALLPELRSIVSDRQVAGTPTAPPPRQRLPTIITAGLQYIVRGERRGGTRARRNAPRVLLCVACHLEAKPRSSTEYCRLRPPCSLCRHPPPSNPSFQRYLFSSLAYLSQEGS